MRSTRMLKSLNDVNKLSQWLYADEAHTIIVENTAGSRLELSMTETGNVMCRHLDIKNQPVEAYDHALSIPVWIDIIGQLEEQPAVTGNFESRWKEIQFEIAATRALIHRAIS